MSISPVEFGIEERNDFDRGVGKNKQSIMMIW